jgi:hypothetical protein
MDGLRQPLAWFCALTSLQGLIFVTPRHELHSAFEALVKLVQNFASTPKLAIRQDLSKHVEWQQFSDSDMAGNAEPGNKRRLETDGCDCFLKAGAVFRHADCRQQWLQLQVLREQYCKVRTRSE